MVSVRTGHLCGYVAGSPRKRETQEPDAMTTDANTTTTTTTGPAETPVVVTTTVQTGGDVQQSTPDPYAQYSENDAGVLKNNQLAYLQKKAEIKLENERWRGRQYMAWLAMISMILATVAMMFWVPETRMDKLADVVTWFFAAMSSVVGAYLGTTTWAFISNAKSKLKNAPAVTPFDGYTAAKQDSSYYSEK